MVRTLYIFIPHDFTFHSKDEIKITDEQAKADKIMGEFKGAI